MFQATTLRKQMELMLSLAQLGLRQQTLVKEYALLLDLDNLPIQDLDRQHHLETAVPLLLPLGSRRLGFRLAAAGTDMDMGITITARRAAGAEKPRGAEAGASRGHLCL